MTSANLLPSSILSSRAICGNAIVTPDGLPIGRLRDLMIDPIDMSVAFAIIDFEAATPDLREERFALPFELLEVDGENHLIILRLAPPARERDVEARNST